VLQGVAPVVLGAAAAVLTTALINRSPEPARPTSAVSERPSDRQTPGSRAIVASPDGKTAELERRLSELEALQERGAPDSNEPRADSTPPPDPEVIERELEERQGALLAKHESEPPDPSWAPQAISAFDQDLADLAKEREVRAVRVDCRTTSCTAVLEWPNYEAAQRENGEIAMHGYKVNCRRHIYVPAPEDRAAPYQATAIFDCSPVREAGL
jgi:hypothetical protein